LHRLADWFEKCGVRTVAMESTGVYWIPVFEILDQRGFEVILVNARDAKHVPGRKTDIAMLNGCSGCMNTGCSEPASG
jgi:transposase